MHVEEALVVVHPDLCHARRVDAVRVLWDEVVIINKVLQVTIIVTSDQISNL